MPRSRCTATKTNCTFICHTTLASRTHAVAHGFELSVTHAFLVFNFDRFWRKMHGTFRFFDWLLPLFVCREPAAGGALLVFSERFLTALFCFAALPMLLIC